MKIPFLKRAVIVLSLMTITMASVRVSADLGTPKPRKYRQARIAVPCGDCDSPENAQPGYVPPCVMVPTIFNLNKPLGFSYAPLCGPGGPNTLGCQCVIAEVLQIWSSDDDMYITIGTQCTPMAYPCINGDPTLNFVSTLSTYPGGNYRYTVGFFSSCQSSIIIRSKTWEFAT